MSLVDAVRAAGRGSASRPNPAMMAATAAIEGPRVHIVDESGLTALTKDGPAPGTYAFLIAPGSEQLLGWVGDHWEVVAQSYVATIPTSETPDRRPSPAQFTASPGGASVGGGGSGVSVAPRGSGDPNIIDPMPGAPTIVPTILVASTGDTVANTFVIPIGGSLTIFSWVLPNPVLLPFPYDATTLINVFGYRAIPGPGGQIREVQTINGNVVSDITNGINATVIGGAYLAGSATGLLGTLATLTLHAIGAGITVTALVANSYVFYLHV